MILACDGVSEGSFSNGEVCQLAAKVLKETGGDAAKAAEAVCMRAVETDSKVTETRDATPRPPPQRCAAARASLEACVELAPPRVCPCAHVRVLIICARPVACYPTHRTISLA